MKKRMKKSKPETVEVQQLSPVDIQRKEALYRKDLTDYKGGLIAGERFKNKGIKKLAIDLEEAGTIETHKISARITNDLKDVIEKKLLAVAYVSVSLDKKYKQTTKPKKDLKNEISGQQPPTQTTTSTGTSTYGMPSTPAQATEEPKQSPQTVKEEQDHDDFVQDMYSTIMRTTEMITGYKEDKILKLNDNLALISETRQFRFDLTKKLAELDLKTIYGDSRRLAIVLNDFLKALENELQSRKKKEELTSE